MDVVTIVAVMGAGYALLMALLAFGLRAGAAGAAGRTTGAAGRRAPRRVPAGRWRRGWPGLVRQVAGTVVGGWLLLVAVVVGYYHGVAGLGGGFLGEAFTGLTWLLCLVLPPLFAASWLEDRLRRRRGRRGKPGRGDGIGGKRVGGPDGRALR
ncbi:DUF6256 family protein [Streptomyces sp. 4N509B]|uniref:DUF6256 family protein n=1 Tax=Streptomyces sp. 4N509B TaxID=3457413 RepID=UPI003FCF0763